MEKKLLAIATSGDPENRLREALAREVGGTSNRARLELVIDIVPGLLSRIARERPIAEIAPVLAQWDRVQRTVRDAIRGSYDGARVGFEIGNCLAELAPLPERTPTCRYPSRPPAASTPICPKLTPPSTTPTPASNTN